jgi:DNA-binding transcriptional LysR family regulator
MTVHREHSMDFDRLRTFHTVARRLSFSRAAEDLYTSQPNVSRQIAKLESELGLPLFQRAGNRVALTDAGRIVEDYAVRTFELTDGLQRSLNELKGLERGYLRLAAGSTAGLYVLPGAMAGFRRQHPGLDMSLHVGNSQEALALLMSGEADLAFIDAPVSVPLLQVQAYATDELVLVAAPQWLAPAGKSEPDLAGETLLLREPGSATRQVTEQALARWQVKAEHVLVVNHSEGLKRAAMAGMGLAFLSTRAVALEIEQGLLVVVGGERWRIPRQLSVASREDIRPPMTALSFLAHLRKTRQAEA